ncbi:MAG TPA: hypothetical protein PKE38_11845 [Ignavibacteriaceae bacterium]|nr:hypothetical protein [Ignavibacteriaceae bacterium]
MSTENKKPIISPEEYKKILKGLDLISISLKESKTFINTDINPPIELSIQIKDEASYKIKDDRFVFIFQKYKIDARKPESKTRFIQIEVVFLVKVHSEDKFTDEFFDIYKNVSLHLNTWPYLREFVNQTTSRMNIPPLTLPFYKTP